MENKRLRDRLTLAGIWREGPEMRAEINEIAIRIDTLIRQAETDLWRSLLDGVSEALHGAPQEWRTAVKLAFDQHKP